MSIESGSDLSSWAYLLVSPPALVFFGFLVTILFLALRKYRNYDPEGDNINGKEYRRMRAFTAIVILTIITLAIAFVVSAVRLMS